MTSSTTLSVSRLVLVLLIVVPQISSAEDTSVVATKVAPPFSFRGTDGNWQGISIELWERIAQSLKLPATEFRELTLAEMLLELENGTIAAATAAISVTPERERRVDFSHPYFFSGLGVAVSATGGGDLLDSVAAAVFTFRTLTILAAAILLLLFFGILFWLLEHRRNPMFRNLDARQGIGLGFWWSLALLLGNKGLLPASATARMLAFGGMITSLLLVGTFVGAIASFLTLSQLERDITQPEDLRHLRVVTVSDTTSEDYLRQLRIGYRPTTDLNAAAEEVVAKRADAIVYDRPPLRYLVNDQYQDELRVLGLTFQPQEYAIALPRHSPLRKPINESLLRLRTEPGWDELLFRYLGD